MTVALLGRLGRLEAKASPRASFVVAVEDEAGGLWRWDEDPPVPVDPAALPPVAQLVVLGLGTDGSP